MKVKPWESEVSVWGALAVMAVCFVILTWCASWFVDGAVGIADYLNVPKILIGIVLVSLATTSPELAVSLMSALDGHPEIALGNAIGSVIVDDGVALGLGAVVATAPIRINPYVLKTLGLFFLAVAVCAYAMAFDGGLDRIEGGVLVSLFLIYMIFTFINRRRTGESDTIGNSQENEAPKKGIFGLIVWFLLGLVGVLISSHFIVDASIVIAKYLGVGEVMIGLTIVAIGTSLPEIATAVTACRKGHGEIMVGNILGADILNLCWIAGASALVNPLIVGTRVTHFSFPVMLIFVTAILVVMRTRYQLARGEGIFLIVLYVVYLIVTIGFFL